MLFEIRTLGYEGGYTILKDYLRAWRPQHPLAIEQRFEVAKGEQAQVDFATFKTPFGTVYALLRVPVTLPPETVALASRVLR